MPATRELLRTLGQLKASLQTLAEVVLGGSIPVPVALVNPTTDPSRLSYFSDWAVTFSAQHLAFQASIYVVDRGLGLGLKQGHQISARRMPEVMRAVAEAAGAAAPLNPGFKRLLAASCGPSELRHRVRAVLIVAAFVSDATQLLLACLAATSAQDILLVAFGGAVLLDSGLEATRLAAGLGAQAPAGWQESSRNAFNGVGWLLRLPALLGGAMPDTVAGLRATVLRPEAVLGYLRAFPAAMAAVYQAIPEAEAGAEEPSGGSRQPPPRPVGGLAASSRR